MSKKKQGTSLPPLDDSGSLSARSPRQNKKMTSYDYRPDSTSPTTSPRSQTYTKEGNITGKPRNSATKEVEKDFRTLCIGSPIPASDPHHEDMITPEPKHNTRDKPRPFHKTPSITIDRVDELNLSKENKGGKGGSSSGAPLSPVSYDLIERMPSTPFAKTNKKGEKMLLISPTTPPVERKGNRQVINYCRSDGHLSSLNCSDDCSENEAERRHNRSHTEGDQSDGRNKSGDLSAMNPKRRDLSTSPRLTRRARENEGTFSPAEREPQRTRSKNGRKGGNEQLQYSPRDAHTSSSPINERRQKESKAEKDRHSPRHEGKKPARLQPLKK